MASAYTKSLIKTFLQQHSDDIMTAIADTGLFFPAVVGQLSVESANGTSDLAAQFNNYGGIKGNADNGVRMDTTETNRETPTVAYFKTYDDFPEFMRDYVGNLKQPRYINGGVFEATSPEDQITRMVKSGYSTKTPKAYLSGGVQDRINATRELLPFGRITSSDVAAVNKANELSVCDILHINDNNVTTNSVCCN